METKKEFAFAGNVQNGFLMLFINLLVLIASGVIIVYGIIYCPWLILAGGLLLLVNLCMWCDARAQRGPCDHVVWKV